MSAFVVSDRHVATLVRNYAALVPLNDAEQALLANVLLQENIRSVNHRYKENTPFDHCEMDDWKIISPAEALSLCDCLDYQSCETPDWEQSFAFHQLTRMKAAFEAAQGSALRSDNLWEI